MWCDCACGDGISCGGFYSECDIHRHYAYDNCPFGDSELGDCTDENHNVYGSFVVTACCGPVGLVHSEPSCDVT